MAYKRARLAISDPVSSAIFFHGEISLFFEHYVKVGEKSVFGRVSQHFGAVKINERGALHVHGLLWLQGNMQLSSVLTDVRGEEGASYRGRIVTVSLSMWTVSSPGHALISHHYMHGRALIIVGGVLMQLSAVELQI